MIETYINPCLGLHFLESHFKNIILRRGLEKVGVSAVHTENLPKSCLSLFLQNIFLVMCFTSLNNIKLPESYACMEELEAQQ